MGVQKLSKSNENIVIYWERLNDTTVNASQRVIAICYCLCNGSQDINLSQTLAFNIQRSLFVQVLHTEYGH